MIIVIKTSDGRLFLLLGHLATYQLHITNLFVTFPYFLLAVHIGNSVFLSTYLSAQYHFRVVTLLLTTSSFVILLFFGGLTWQQTWVCYRCFKVLPVLFQSAKRGIIRGPLLFCQHKDELITNSNKHKLCFLFCSSLVFLFFVFLLWEFKAHDVNEKAHFLISSLITTAFSSKCYILEWR